MIFQYVTHSTRNPLSGFWTGHGEWLNLEKKLWLEPSVKIDSGQNPLITYAFYHKHFGVKIVIALIFALKMEDFYGKNRVINKKKIDDFFTIFLACTSFISRFPSVPLEFSKLANAQPSNFVPLFCRM